MSYIVIFTKEGIKLIDGGGLVNPQNVSEVLSITRNAANNSVPVIGGAADTQLFGELVTNLGTANVSAFTRDAMAAVLGTIAGILTLPLGPISALAVDQLMSEAFKRGYDAANRWSAGQDWSPFLAEIEKVRDGTHVIRGSRSSGVDPTTNTRFQAAQNWVAPREPLVLDLDNDGIEAVGINPTAPILFDMDGDGIKTATGWIKADDGMLVLDRNGNGLIDSGRELFGDATILTRGPRAGQTAANVYEALADLDINGDGAINSLDAAYASLRIWQDANQDGISQASELRTLGEVGIASMNVAGQVSNINLGNGNAQPFSGTVTRTNGSTGASGVAEVSGSFLLASNNFYLDSMQDTNFTVAA